MKQSNLRKSKKEEYPDYEKDGWVKGRNAHNKQIKESKEERNKKRKEETIKRNNLKKEQIKLKRAKEKKEKLEKYLKDYILFREVGFDRFKELTGYTKTFSNLIMLFEYNLDEYVSNGTRAIKKRNMENKLDGV